MPGRLLISLVAAGLLAAGFGYVAVHDPSVPGAFPQCLFHQATGLHCPGCGSTRAVHALLHGDFGAALGMNGLCVLLLPFLLVALPLQAVAWVRRTPPPTMAPPGAARALLWVVLAFWLLRNLPFLPFTALAPA